MISNLVKCGDKVEISAASQIVDGTKVNIKDNYFSTIYDFDEENVTIYMPMEKGKIILLPNGMLVNLLFYCEKGLYKCSAVVKERYKEENIFLMNLEIKSKLNKFQRRDYYRWECLIDLDYRILAPQLKIQPLTWTVLDSYIEHEDTSDVLKGTILDISGGGMRFSSKKEIQKDSMLLLSFVLESATVNYDMVLLGRVLSCEKDDLLSISEKRVEFVQIKEEEREKIVKYIFEEERRMRNIKKG